MEVLERNRQIANAQSARDSQLVRFGRYRFPDRRRRPQCPQPVDLADDAGRVSTGDHHLAYELVAEDAAAHVARQDLEIGQQTPPEHAPEPGLGGLWLRSSVTARLGSVPNRAHARDSLALLLAVARARRHLVRSPLGPCGCGFRLGCRALGSVAAQ
jgi:hypothetical protein